MEVIVFAFSDVNIDNGHSIGQYRSCGGSTTKLHWDTDQSGIYNGKPLMKLPKWASSNRTGPLRQYTDGSRSKHLWCPVQHRVAFPDGMTNTYPVS